AQEQRRETFRRPSGDALAHLTVVAAGVGDGIAGLLIVASAAGDQHHHHGERSHGRSSIQPFGPGARECILAGMTTPYNEVEYASFPSPESHPDRLRLIGHLFHREPAPVERCRVLEIGCGSGANLIPMAETLPESKFRGFDLAESAVAIG